MFFQRKANLAFLKGGEEVSCLLYAFVVALKCCFVNSYLLLSPCFTENLLSDIIHTTI